MYNLKLKSRKAKVKSFVLSFKDIHSDDDWLTGDHDEENMQTKINVE